MPKSPTRTVNSYIPGDRPAAGPPEPAARSIPTASPSANYREINAFALPGGPVWMHRGAIAAAANEAQLAAVLAHEVAHISQRHAADQISQQLVANGFIGLLGALLGNDRSAQTAQIGARVLAGGYMLKFSRDDEREADTVGAAIMRRAGWDATRDGRLHGDAAKRAGQRPSRAGGVPVVAPGLQRARRSSPPHCESWRHARHPALPADQGAAGADASQHGR